MLFCAGRRHGEFATAHFSQPGDAFADHLLGGVGETQPDPFLSGAGIGHPFGARID